MTKIFFKTLKKLFNLKKNKDKNIYPEKKDLKFFSSNFKNTFKESYSVFSVDGSFFKENGFTFYTIQSVLIKYGKNCFYKNKEFFHFEEESQLSEKIEEKMLQLEYLTIKNFLESKINEISLSEISTEKFLIIADGIIFTEEQKKALFEINKKSKNIKIISYFSNPSTKIYLEKSFSSESFSKINDSDFFKKYLKKDSFTDKVLEENSNYSIYLNTGLEISKIICIKNENHEIEDNLYFLNILFSQIKKGSGFPIILQHVHNETQKINIFKKIIKNKFYYLKTKNLTKNL